MKIAIFSPNLSRKCIGGAEIYALFLAAVLSENNEITIFTCYNPSHNYDINKVYDKYGSPHFNTVFVKYIPTGHEHIKELVDLLLEPMRHKISKEYDLFINATQNRLKAPSKLPSIHIIHFPDNNLDKFFPRFIAKRLNRRYADSYSLYLPNSQFTQYYFKKYWGKESKVLYPPIIMQPITDEEFSEKENVILAVDRLVRDKNILEMINSFITLCNEYKNDYKFVIIGASNPKQMDYYDQILKTISGKPIELYSDLDLKELQSWYKRAKIFWHAKGYGVDEDDPFHMEHFGMTTVEAMINGCVPVVINKAGQKEIIENKEQGFKWDTLDELINYTKRLINDDNQRLEMAKASRERGKQFMLPVFSKKANQIVEELKVCYENKNNS